MCHEDDRRPSTVSEVVGRAIKEHGWILYVVLIYLVLMFVAAAVKIITLLTLTS